MDKKRRALLLATACIALFVFVPVVSAALSSRTLANDLAYYHRIAKEKKLEYNDRCYILTRIRDKYRNTKVNLTPLSAELRKLQSHGTKSASAPQKRAAAPASARGGTVDKLLIGETARETRITVVARGVARHNYFLLRDPEPGRPPKVVLDLYGATNRLSPRARDVSLRNGLFSRVQSSQFEDKPVPIVRVVAQLRHDAPYLIRRQGDRWLIIAEKDAAATPAQDDEPPLQSEMIPAAVQEPGSVAPVPEQASVMPVHPNDDDATPSLAPPPSLMNATSASYRIETADVLGITIFPADELSRETVVQYDGTIIFPLVGSVKATGLSPRQLEDALKQGLSRYLSNPQVTVTIKQFSRRQVFVTGEVRSVGAYNYRDNMRLLEFISSLGGFTDNANRREVKVYRGTGEKRKIFTNDLEDIIRSGDFSKDFVLEPGDIVEVPEGRARVAVLGDVRSPGYYDYRDNLCLLELVSLAGGFTDTAAINKVSILRDNAARKDNKTVAVVNLKKVLNGKEKDVAVASGDTIYIPKKNLASANWFATNILPWLSLVSLVLLIRGGV